MTSGSVISIVRCSELLGLPCFGEAVDVLGVSPLLVLTLSACYELLYPFCIILMYIALVRVKSRVWCAF